MSNKLTFGLCDKPHPAKEPAFINEDQPDSWISEVENLTQLNIEFYAIDNCVSILRPNGKDEKKCDGVLLFNNTLIFVELKDRAHNGWLGVGIEQIKKTLEYFVVNYNLGSFKINEVYVCNKQHPFAVKGVSAQVQKFKDDTASILQNYGILLKVDRKIRI